MYFGRRNSPENHGGVEDPQDIWYSNLNDEGKWGEPKRLDTPINDKWANSVCNISEDGKTAFLYNTYKNLNYPIVKSYLTSTGWSQPSPMVISDYYNYNQYSDFFIGLNGKVILMAIEREGV